MKKKGIHIDSLRHVSEEEYFSPVKDTVGHASNSAGKELNIFSDWEGVLSLTVLIFGLICLFIEVYLIKSGSIREENAIRFIVITLIVISTLFLITAGYSNDQIAPALGLLGTIAGYLLGKTNSSKQNENE